MPSPRDPDANISFTLTDEGRTRLIRTLDTLTQNLPRASAILTDTSGRIVDITRRPLGANLEELAALAAGCHATTQALARTMGETSATLVFEHEDDQRVCIWPVLTRALLVVFLRDKPSVEALEQRLAGPLGQALTAVVLEGREPLRKVPPPRVVLSDVPAEVRTQVRALTSRIMAHQDLWAGRFTPDMHARLLRAREDLMQALRFENWPNAMEICTLTDRWLQETVPKR